MLDFFFRRGNPTNNWQRTPGLNLVATLDVPALIGVPLGAPFDQLSFLGRNDELQFGTLCYYDLGIGVDRAEDGTLEGYTVVFEDESDKFEPFRGRLLWKGERLAASQLARNNLQRVFGGWYWLDEDEDESIAFFEYSGYELQVEISAPGAVKRLTLTREPLMADPDQRKAYGVDKPWLPRYRCT